ncbi:MAG TPA: XRE family transcriptional regulator [Desulfobulbaceae bacterium]|nr:XRE family transcriptional regulator [Desulfobulbaceae bacterium]
MQAPTKKHPNDEMVNITLRVRRSALPLLRKFAESLEPAEGSSWSLAEVFPEYIGKEQELALRAYRNREGLTQKQLAALTGIPQRHISEMENGKRCIGKERAKKLAAALHCDYRRLI